jgi:hypothetical protein
LSLRQHIHDVSTEKVNPELDWSIEIGGSDFQRTKGATGALGSPGISILIWPNADSTHLSA